MALTSLLVCADAKTVQALSRILLKIGMSVEHCGDPSIALANFSTKHFDAVLVDCEKEETATAFISQLRSNRPDEYAVIVAIVNSRNNPREIFAKGAHFILFKPLPDDGLSKTTTAAKAAVRSEKRSNQRIPVEANASIAYASTENEVAKVVDLSGDGIAIYSAKPLPRNCKVYFQFSLPDDPSTIRLSCEVIWQNGSGNVGLRFVDVPKTSRRVLDYWMKNKVGNELQIAPSPSLEAEGPGGVRLLLARHLSLIAATPSERRQRPRHACALGAEVSRAGSTIQQRCVVSDISMGGCYVQTSEPLPVGTAIEIALRTQELKLRVPGKVQSVHRGLGMGVHFISAKTPTDLQRLVSEVEKQPVSV